MILILFSFFPYPSVTLGEIRDEFSLSEASTGYIDLFEIDNPAFLLKDNLRELSISFADFLPKEWIPKMHSAWKKDGVPMCHIITSGCYSWEDFSVVIDLLKTKANYYWAHPYRVIGDLTFASKLGIFDFGFGYGCGKTAYYHWRGVSDFGSKIIGGINYDHQIGRYNLSTGLTLGQFSGMFNQGWDWLVKDRGIAFGHILVKDHLTEVLIYPEVATDWLDKKQIKILITMERRFERIGIHFETGYWHNLLLWHENEPVELKLGFKYSLYPWLMINLLPRFYYELHQLPEGLLENYEGLAIHGGIRLKPVE